MNRQPAFETTLGNLVAAPTEKICLYIHDEKQAYKVAAFMLAHLLRNSCDPFKRQQCWH